MYPVRESAPEAKSRHHDGVCAHCGGEVDADGMSAGGVIESDVTPEADVDEGNDSKQRQIDVQMRNEGGFAAALRRRRGGR